MLCILQRSDEGVAQGRLAMELDPLNSNVKLLSSATLPCVGDCKTPLTLAEEVSADDPANYLANQGIYMLAYKCKEYNKVFKAEKYNLSMFDVTEDDMKEIESIYNKQGFIKAYEKIMIHLEKFAENNFIQPIEMATRYIMADQPEKTMDWLEKGYKLNDPTMPYIATEIFVFAPLFNNPRFIAICEKMNLLLPKSD